MAKVLVGMALRDRLGESGARDFVDYVEQQEQNWRADVVNQLTERLDLRMSECARRNEMTDGFSRIAAQMADTKVEILRWSFAFWVGQVAVIAVLLSYMLKS